MENTSEWYRAVNIAKRCSNIIDTFNWLAIGTYTEA